MEHELGRAAQHLPAAGRHLALELPRRPGRVPRVEPQVVRAVGEANHVGQRRVVDAQEHLVEHLGAVHGGRRETAYQVDEARGRDRSAAEQAAGIGADAVGKLGEHLGRRERGGPIEHHPDRAVGAMAQHEHDGAGKGGVRLLRRRDEQRAVRDRLSLKRRSGERGRGGRCREPSVELRAPLSVPFSSGDTHGAMIPASAAGGCIESADERV